MNVELCLGELTELDAPALVNFISSRGEFWGVGDRILGSEGGWILDEVVERAPIAVGAAFVTNLSAERRYLPGSVPMRCRTVIHAPVCDSFAGGMEEEGVRKAVGAGLVAAMRLGVDAVGFPIASGIRTSLSVQAVAEAMVDVMRSYRGKLPMKALLVARKRESLMAFDAAIRFG